MGGSGSIVRSHHVCAGYDQDMRTTTFDGSRGTFLKLAAAVVVAAGCGGGEDPELFDEPTPVPAGPHHTFVVRDVTMATDSAEAFQLGLDIDHKPEDGVDNQLGTVLGSVRSLLPLADHLAPLDRGIATGEPIFLLSLRGPALDAGPLELHTIAGASPVPAPCRDGLDEICGRHLEGTGSFAVAEPRAEVPITGLHEDDTYLGGAGDIVLPIVMGGRTVWLPVTRARAELSDVSTTRVFGKLGGAVRHDALYDLLVPAYAEHFRALFAADCVVGTLPPECGCTPGTPGTTVRDMFDKAPTQNCQITDDEVGYVATGLLTPDIDVDGDGVNDALSWGIGIEAVPGDFTP